MKATIERDNPMNKGTVAKVKIKKNTIATTRGAIIKKNENHQIF